MREVNRSDAAVDVSKVFTEASQADAKAEYADAKNMNAQLWEQRNIDKPHQEKKAFKAKRKGLKDRMAKVRVQAIKQSSEKSDSGQKNGIGARLDRMAKNFAARNPELDAGKLKELREKLTGAKNQDEVMELVQEFDGDPTLQDEALEFLQETADGELREMVDKAREKHGTEKHREIVAGKNVSETARSFSDQVGKSASELRDLYRDITGNPREPNKLFDELSKEFSYKKLKEVLKFLFRSLGNDLKAPGPSIDPEHLRRLMRETKSLQSLYTVLRYFKKRQPFMEKQFNEEELVWPKQLGFESMATTFMDYIGNRYPSAAKALKMATKLALKETLAKIITLSVMRDAVNNVASLYYRSHKHRHEILESIIECLEDLEEQYEEEMAESEEEEHDDDDFDFLDDDDD